MSEIVIVSCPKPFESIKVSGDLSGTTVYVNKTFTRRHSSSRRQDTPRRQSSSRKGM